MPELRSALEGEDVDQIQSRTETLSQAAMKVGEALYQASSREAADAGDGGEHAGPDGDGTTEPEEDEKVVDADFEEVDDEHKGKSA